MFSDSPAKCHRVRFGQLESSEDRRKIEAEVFLSHFLPGVVYLVYSPWVSRAVVILTTPAGPPQPWTPVIPLLPLFPQPWKGSRLPAAANPWVTSPPILGFLFSSSNISWVFPFSSSNIFVTRSPYSHFYVELPD